MVKVMLVFPLLFLIPANEGTRCYNLSSAKSNQKLQTVTSEEKTVGESFLKLTFFNFDSQNDKMSYQYNRTTARFEFNISVVHHRSMISSLGVPFRFSVRDGSFNQYECYEPVIESSDETFQSLKTEVVGTTSTSKDFYLRAHKSIHFCGSHSDSYSSGPTTSQGFTTSSPETYLEIYVFLSVRIIESLDIQIDSISDIVLRVSVNKIKSKDNIAPYLSCFVNEIKVTESPHFLISSKLHESSRNKHLSSYSKEENEVRSVILKQKCWLEACSGPLICSASRSGVTYWSNTVYLSKGSDLRDCMLDSNFTVSNRDESSGKTSLKWSCMKEADQTPYIVYIKQTLTEEDNQDSCMLRFQTDNTSCSLKTDQLEPDSCTLRFQTDNTSCSLKTDQLEPGVPYKVWVTTSAGKLVVDVTNVLIPGRGQSEVMRVLVWVLAGCGVVVVGLVGFLVMICKQGREKWRESEVQKLNKEDLEGYESSDVVIIHITNSAFTPETDL